MPNQENEAQFFEKLISSSESIDVKKLLLVFLSRWYWILASVLLCITIGYLSLKFAKPLYVASITFKYMEKQSELDELGSTKPTYIFSNSNSDYLTERFNVRSQEVVENALIKLNQQFTFYRIKDLRKLDVYPFAPLKIKVNNYSPEKFKHGLFRLDENLVLHYIVGDDIIEWQPKNKKNISVPGLDFQIQEVNTKFGYEYEFHFNDFSDQAARVLGSIDMQEVEEAMPVMNLSFRHQNFTFTKDFITKLIESYTEFDIRKKQKSSDLTIQFIRKQLNIYSDSLKVAARELEIFKKNNQVLDINNSALEVVGKLQEIEEQKQKLEIQMSYTDILENNLTKNYQPINYLAVGLDQTSDANLTENLAAYNTIIQKRKELLLKYSPNSEAAKLLDEQLIQIRTQIKDNIALQRQKNKGLNMILDKRLKNTKGKFNQIPELEKNFLYLQSNFEVNKNIYSLLLNKDIESAIVRAGILPTFTTISRLYVDQVSPKPTQILLLSLFLGLAIGLGAILLVRFSNSKFSDLHKVDQHPKADLLGVVNHFPNKLTNTAKDLNLFVADRSIFTESMSAIRTKLSFSSSNIENKIATVGKQIVITSQLSGEGKSFVTINLALSFLKIDKTVLIIGADIRKSKLQRYFINNRKTAGLTEFLQGKTDDISDIINDSGIPNLDIIKAGVVSFNPGELLQKARFKELLSYARNHYDYVLIDTAPIGLVADSIPLLASCDHVLFIIRWLKSNENAYNFAWKIAEEYKIKEIKFIINDFHNDQLFAKITSGDNTPEAYGYYGGYGGNGYYVDQPKRWYQKFFKKS